MKYKITVLSKSSNSKSGIADAIGILKTVGESFKCEFEVVYHNLKKEEELSREELELCKNSDAVVLETADKTLNQHSSDQIKAQLNTAGSYTQTEYGAIFEAASIDDVEEEDVLDKHRVDSILSLASMLDYLKQNEAARLLRQGVDHVLKTSGKIQKSNKKTAEAISQFVKSRLAAANPKKLQQAYDEMLLSFGGVVDV